LSYVENTYNIRNFDTFKEDQEGGVLKFKQGNNVEEIALGRYRKRTYSADLNSVGAYYMYNWINVDEYPCKKPPFEEKTAHIIYEILASRWEKASHYASELPKSLEVSTLQFVLKGFRTIEQLLQQENSYFQDHFMNRESFRIAVKVSSDSIGGPFVFINLFEEESAKKFKEIKALPRKVECLRMNLEYLVNFAAKYHVKEGDDYITLAFRLMGNLIDQNEPILDYNKDYAKILTKLDLKLSDRLNFATKLLPEKKRKLFCTELEDTLFTFPSLDNILYYLPANSTKK
jgi:hypothetical protein